MSEIRDRVLDEGDSLESNYQIYPIEEALEHLGLGHKRAIEGHFKIIFLIEGDLIYITDLLMLVKIQQK